MFTEHLLGTRRSLGPGDTAKDKAPALRKLAFYHRRQTSNDCATSGGVVNAQGKNSPVKVWRVSHGGEGPVGALQCLPLLSSNFLGEQRKNSMQQEFPLVSLQSRTNFFALAVYDLLGHVPQLPATWARLSQQLVQPPTGTLFFFSFLL